MCYYTIAEMACGHEEHLSGVEFCSLAKARGCQACAEKDQIAVESFSNNKCSQCLLMDTIEKAAELESEIASSIKNPAEKKQNEDSAETYDKGKDKGKGTV